MKMSEARRIIELGRMPPKGYMVAFWRVNDSNMETDHFPDKHAGEDLIPTEFEAWALAEEFAKATVGTCLDVRVVDNLFHPVSDRRIKNLAPGQVTSMVQP